MEQDNAPSPPLVVTQEQQDAVQEMRLEKALALNEASLRIAEVIQRKYNTNGKSDKTEYIHREASRAVENITYLGDLLSKYRYKVQSELDASNEAKLFEYYKGYVERSPQSGMEHFNRWIFPILGPKVYNFGFKRQILAPWRTT